MSHRLNPQRNIMAMLAAGYSLWFLFLLAFIRLQFTSDEEKEK